MKEYCIDAPENEVLSLDLKDNEYLSNKKPEILKFLDSHQRILIDSSPGTGKTFLFTRICHEIQDGIRHHRIIFCSPFLLIQTQFGCELEKEGIKVDLEVRGKVKRSQIKHAMSDMELSHGRYSITPKRSARIITSTYKGFSKIVSYLRPNDMVVVDEAHACYMYYPKQTYVKNKKFSHDYHHKFLTQLLKLNSKLVLMTGTPLEGMHEFLDVKPVKVSKSLPDNKILLKQVKADPVDLAMAFARKCLSSQKKGTLNVIYIKNVSLCEAVKFQIEQELNVQAVVITSHHKETKSYIELGTRSVIDSNYSFLICTNVLGTGTNILNENMGKALMIEEYDPVEIKQFANRFRKHTEMPIHVFNSFEAQTSGVQSEGFRKRQAEIHSSYNQLFKCVIEWHQKYSNYYHDFNIRFEQSNKGSELELAESVTLRYLIHYANLRNSIYSNGGGINELIKRLTNFENIDVKVTPKLTILSNNHKGIQEKISRKRILDSVSEVLAEPQKHLQHISYFLENSEHYYIESIRFQERFEKHINIKMELVPEILEKVRGTDFHRYVTEPLIELYPDIQDLELTLALIGTRQKGRYITHHQLAFNRCFHRYFKVIQSKSKNQKSPPTLKDHPDFNTSEMSASDRVIKGLLAITFNYLINNDYINLTDYMEFLNVEAREICGSQNLEYPANLFEYSRPNWNLLPIKKFLATSLLRSVFWLANDPVRKKRDSKMLPTLLFASIEDNKALQYQGVTNKKGNAYKFRGEVHRYNKKVTKENHRILLTSDLIKAIESNKSEIHNLLINR